jgi:hypothetical protein
MMGYELTRIGNWAKVKCMVLDDCCYISKEGKVMRRVLTVVVVGLLGLGLALAEERGGEKGSGESKGSLPDGAKGFAGMVSGKVIAKDGNGLVIEVTKIDRTWKHSKAENASVLVGKRVKLIVVPQTYAKKEGYAAKVQKFFNLLKAGDTESFDVKDSETGCLKFLELTEAQKERVEKAGK